MATKLHIPGRYAHGDRKIVKRQGREWDVPFKATDYEIDKAVESYLQKEAMERLISFGIMYMLIKAAVSAVNQATFNIKVKRYSRRPSRRRIEVGQMSTDNSWVKLQN